MKILYIAIFFFLSGNIYSQIIAQPSDTATYKIKVQSTDTLRKIILTESKVGGKLDFFTEIKGKENDGVQVNPGTYITLGSFAIYRWGREVSNLGIKNIEEAYSIFSELKSRTLNEKEKAYIKMGFLKELEK